MKVCYKDGCGIAHAMIFEIVVGMWCRHMSPLWRIVGY